MRFISWMFISLAFAASAAAQETARPLPSLQPYNSLGFYDVSWSGISVGGMVIDAKEDDKTYQMDVKIKSDGLAWTFTKHKSTTTIAGIKRKNEYIPQQFETWFSLRKDTRHIVLDYDKNGRLTHEVNTPPEDRNKRPEVPMELKKDVVDALSIFFIQRQKVYETLKNGSDTFTLRMYDGRRLTDMHYFVQGRKQVEWNRQHVPVIVFNLTRTPVAGFKDSELEDFEANKDPAVSLYLSDDGKLLPLKIIVDSSAGKFYANFKTACPSTQACDKLLK